VPIPVLPLTLLLLAEVVTLAAGRRCAGGAAMGLLPEAALALCGAAIGITTDALFGTSGHGPAEQAVVGLLGAWLAVGVTHVLRRTGLPS